MFELLAVSGSLSLQPEGFVVNVEGLDILHSKNTAHVVHLTI